MKPLTVAVAQLCSGEDKEANLQKAETYIRQAAQKGAKLIVFPEWMNYIGSTHNPSTWEPVPGGESCQRMANAAKKNCIWVHMGTVLETVDGSEKAYNTSALFSPMGNVVATYRKTHLCDIMDTPQTVIRESDTTTPGDEIVTVKTELGHIGMSICYDVRFPELYRKMALEGAEILCHPACFGCTTGSAHWELLVRSMALHTGSYVLAAGQCGNRPNGISKWGHSMIVDPWGTVIAQAGQEQEALLVADIHLDDVKQIRERLGMLHNRRVEIY